MSTIFYNKALYILRIYYTEKKELLPFQKLVNEIKKEESFKLLNLITTNKILKDIYTKFKTFYTNQINTPQQIKMPHYIKSPNQNYFPIEKTTITINNKKYFKISFSYYAQQLDLKKHIFNNNQLNYYVKYFNINKLSDIYIRVPSKLDGKQLYNIKLLPLFKNHWINLIISFKELKNKITTLKNEEIMAIDIGINNLITSVTNSGYAFIIDGKYLKSINRLYNKKLALYNMQRRNQKEKTKKIFFLTNARNNKIKDYIYKATKYVINYAIENKIEKIVIGYNKKLKENCINHNSKQYLDKIKNQNLIQIPIRKIIDRLSYLAKINNIQFIEINEAYTSICSFYDNELIQYHSTYKGKRIKRGLFITSDNQYVNADVNAALNILAKSKTDTLANIARLRNSGKVIPKRIFINKNL